MTDSEIRLYSLDDNTLDGIKELSEDTFEQIKNDINIINNYKSHFLVFEYFQLNLLEFDKLKKKLYNVPVTNIDIKTIESAKFHLEINRVAFNLLSSFRFFLDHAETHIKRQFGKKSNESKDFKTLTSSFYDEYFSYRFLYKLRNFSQHLGFPIERTHYKTIHNEINPEKSQGNFKLIVGKSTLLKESDLLGALKNEIESMEGDIDIIPFVYQLGKLVGRLEKRIYSFHSLQLVESISNLELFAGKYKTSTNNILIIFDSNLQEGQFNTLTIPFDEIKEIESFKNWNWN
ncbi:hypothetical protein GCQ56_14785 [Marinifilum sp. N1E240]|uniref:hypothetical protein n=1 Tax=Marinifilum sp. N1E240 TaxID=2608082 RepID=UPI00128DB3BA|nr:hypothetical protein [Marinifilum sp. N1E240]MPQ48267.1 hypothetical protein [Marinifilum sp. N1E240]